MDFFGIDHKSIATSQVLDGILASLEDDLRMASTHGPVRQNDSRFRVSADNRGTGLDCDAPGILLDAVFAYDEVNHSIILSATAAAAHLSSTARFQLVEVDVPATLTLNLAANQESIANLAEAVAQFGLDQGLAEDTVRAAQLVLEEAFQNIVLHGKLADQSAVTVRLTKLPHELELEVEDTANPFNPLEHSNPDFSVPLEQRADGGLGIYLIRETMDHVEYRHEDGKNHLIMRKALTPGR